MNRPRGYVPMQLRKNGTQMKNKLLTKLIVVGIVIFGLSGCLGTVVGVVVDTTIEVVKIPFKVGAAVVDVVTDDDDD